MKTETTDKAREWLDSPVVQRAAEAAGGTDDHLLLLEKLVEVMNDLEAKFPGIAFEEILSPTTPAARGKVFDWLVDDGMDPSEARQLAGGYRGEHTGDRTKYGRRLNRAELFAQVHAGLPLEAFDSADRRHVRVLRRRPTEADLEVGRLIQMGVCQEESGRSKNTYHAAKLRLEYAEWQRVTHS